jgi:molybdenum cofactor biosynthesis enzyme MoaA
MPDPWPGELTTAEAKGAYRTFPETVRRSSFHGGEPLMRPDVVELVRMPI